MMLTAIGAGALTWGAAQAPAWQAASGTPSSSESGTPSAEGLRQDELDKLDKVMDLIGSRYMEPQDRKALVDGAIQGMLDSLGDPYSVYMSKEEAAKFTDTTQGAFTGIGADLKKENGVIVVESPIKGSPAERAGLQPRDVLLTVNGESLQGLTLSEAVAKIRGPKGTKAKLKVLRPGAKEPMELELVRDRISVETVESELLQGGIGRLTISQFSFPTATQVQDELKAMEDKGLKALVIDLRNNPGGTLESTLKIAGQFIKTGQPVVRYEYSDGQQTSKMAEGTPGTGKPYPIVVLVNKASASAAEILAGALKQSAGAVLVGETTFGKGTVQISYDKELGDGSLVKLTVFKWLLPDGTWIHHKGIQPDIRVSQPAYWMASKLPRDRVLRRDETGEEVANLQRILEGVDTPADRSDGYFSEGTEKAVKAFQQRERLPVTGEVDERTADRLESSLYAELQKPEKDEQLQAALKEARELLAR
ncbi:PDZ domain-containing protein [Cohnella pontilimi]|uniref:PDZ domain-containing protein n=2 Tax=Cohnella pontilimi TaxID=2564100 RepID=A0A4U0FCS4_9BACL|nr:PDZ domain-containing protein [Cohnella pontilimi]